MKSGFGFQTSLGLISGRSLDGSFRKAESGISPDQRSEFSTSSRFIPTSKRAFKALKDYVKKVVDIESFSYDLEDWILEKTNTDSTGRKRVFRSPFSIDELRKLDYALEGVLFQQLFRMPYSMHASDDLKEDEFVALEDFIHTIIDGLWRTFWHKSGPIPFSVSCPCRPGSKFYSVENAISRGKVGALCGAALVANSGSHLQIQWDQVVEFALFKSDIAQGNELGFSATTVCEALFYGFHILLSRTLSKHNTVGCDSVYLLVLDSKFGGVIKMGGDLRKLVVNSVNPYHSAVEWIKLHAEVNVSAVDRVWNKLGNPCWGDLGTLQLLLATFYSIEQWKGPPRKSIDSLAADHSLRLQKRWIECHLIGNGSGPVTSRQSNHKQGEIAELDCDEDFTSVRKQGIHLKFKQGEVMTVEDSQGQKGFQIQESLVNGNCISYSAVSLENPSELLTVYVGVHPSKLEPSWEDMSLWYQVQRQTKVLNIMKQKGISSKNLPEIICSGQLLHSGPCRKQNAGGRCDHPWCGTPVLVTYPVGEPLSSIIARSGLFSFEEALRCCRDCLSALRNAASASIQHGDICPENVVRVDTSGTGTRFLYMLVSWGRAVLEDRDSPAINLQFSSTYALQQGKLCPASDAESLIYLLYIICGGTMQQQDSIESALQWRERSWARRSIQQQLGEISALLKAFADYVDSLCGTPYPVDYDIWLKRLNRVVDGSDRGKLKEEIAVRFKLEDVPEPSGTSECGAPLSC